MSDFFLLPCAIAPPSLPTLAGLSYTHYAFHTRSASPSPPPPFLSFLQCLHMQSLSECAMSFLLGSAASFTVDWFLFRSRGNGPPFSIILPSSLPSSHPPPGQAAGVGNGPDVRCMVDGRAAPGPRAPAAGGRTGLCWPCVPRAPRPAPRSFEPGETRITPTPSLRLPGTVDSRSRGPCAHSFPGVGRNKPSCFRRGRFVPLGQICCAV